MNDGSTLIDVHPWHTNVYKGINIDIYIYIGIWRSREPTARKATKSQQLRGRGGGGSGGSSGGGGSSSGWDQRLRYTIHGYIDLYMHVRIRT
jgi:hypothetical protein